MSLSRNTKPSIVVKVLSVTECSNMKLKKTSEYLNQQGVTACKRFRIKKDGNLIDTNTLLLTFNTTSLPKSLKNFYRIIPVEIHIPNPPAPVHRGIRNRRTASSVAEFASNLGNPLNGYG